MREVKFETLANDVVRPGIENHLVPLALYRGALSLGQVQAKWNFAIAMMHAECEDYSEAVHLSNNSEFAHLCEPFRKISHTPMKSFFSRLEQHPDITNNVPGLTEYVKLMSPGWQLEKVPLIDNFRRSSVPWRVWREKKKPGREAKPKPVKLVDQSTPFYPFVIHKPKVNDGSYDMMMLVNNAVPRSLPDHIRADICQDLILGILEGAITVDEVKASVKSFSRKVFEMHPMKYGHISLDAPLGDDSGRTLLDVLG